HAKYRAAGEEAERTRAGARDRAQREDLLRFQVSELDAARLRPGEAEELRAERRRLLHAERFRTGLAEVLVLLDDDPHAATTRLARAARLLGDLGRLDAAFATPVEPLEGAQALVEEALTAVRRLRDQVVAEPGRLEAIDERLDALTRLERKYGDTEEAMLGFRAAAAEALARLERHEETQAEQERVLAQLRAELGAAATALSERRRGAATRLAPRVERQLRALGMDRAAFEVAVTEAEAVGARGLDHVEFRLCANPGEERRPLARVASGGELSRAMLGLTAVLARAHRVPTLVFDEVDAGIGGGVASAVAEALVAAAQGRQVLCVTHLAPIAAAAGHHLHVVKAVRGGRTRVTAEVLAGDARARDLGRMLGGDARTALEHARTLLGGRRRG
ncbi:MAG TPA: DNA repair protein RecN, partial [Methylomirabilota bacterium]|nr:DNA repair protein RecN [Methylomirabilota bacterium]